MSSTAAEYFIIKEIYENESASEYFENQLEYALEDKCSIIVIEPTKLGKETSRWIAIGHCLRRTAMLSGFGCVLTGICWQDRRNFYVTVPLSCFSMICALIYTLSWQFDSCSKYLVERDKRRLQRLPLESLSSSTPVILVRQDSVWRSTIHNGVALVSVAFCTWQLYTVFSRW